MEQAKARPLTACEVKERLIDELLCKNSFIKTVTGIEQHGHADGAVLGDVDGGHVANLEIVRDGADGPLAGFQYLEADAGAVRQQGAAPAARAEGADRRQGQQVRVDRQ